MPPPMPRLALDVPMPDRVRVLSDLHIGAGQLQDFVCDAELVEFLEDSFEAGDMVVFNGDALEFPQTLPEIEDEGKDPRIGATEAQSLERFKEIRHAHRRVFRAMRRFVGRGGIMVVQPGNHDIDLVWPAVSEAFREAVDPERSGRLVCRDTLPLVLWDRVWIEHGNQWSLDGNNYKRWWAPFVIDNEGVRHLEQCWGTWFIRHFVNKVDANMPYVDNVWPFTRMMLLVRRHAPLRLAWQMRELYRTLSSTIARPPESLRGGADEFDTRSEQSSFWEAYKKVQERYEEGVEETIRPRTAISGWRHLARHPRGSTGRWLGEAGLLRLLQSLDRRLEREENEVSRFLYGTFVQGWRMGLSAARDTDQVTGARHIMEDFEGITAVLFGHSHIARVDDLMRRRDGPALGRYVNTGTWIPLWDFSGKRDLPDLRTLKTARHFPYKLTWASLERQEGGEVAVELHTFRESTTSLRRRRPGARTKHTHGPTR